MNTLIPYPSINTEDILHYFGGNSWIAVMVDVQRMAPNHNLLDLALSLVVETQIAVVVVVADSRAAAVLRHTRESLPSVAVHKQVVVHMRVVVVDRSQQQQQQEQEVVQTLAVAHTQIVVVVVVEAKAE